MKSKNLFIDTAEAIALIQPFLRLDLLGISASLQYRLGLGLIAWVGSEKSEIGVSWPGTTGTFGHASRDAGNG